MRYGLVLVVLTISIILSGCIETGVEPLGNITGETIKINHIDRNNIINGEDFPDFKLIRNIYYIAPENLSLTPETEMGHGVYEIGANTTVLPGYRIYGGSEAYNSSENLKNSSKDPNKRYILLQYKVFDNNESLNDIISMTAEQYYIKNGFKYRPIDSAYKGRAVVLESNATNYSDVNVTVILFRFDAAIGKIGVQDYKDKSLNESLRILDIVFDRLKVKTKDVKAAKMSSIIRGNKSNNKGSV